MSIAPAQTTMVTIVMDRTAETSRRRETAPRPMVKVAEQAAGTATATQPQASDPKMTTAMRIDERRRPYYAVINNRTGDVVMEIPCEQIRKLAEGLDKSAIKQPATHTVDFKS